MRALLDEKGLRPVNLDAVVLCEEPKLGPFRDAMRERLADAAGLDPADVNVKFTTAEGMGFVGQGEGIARDRDRKRGPDRRLDRLIGIQS